MTKTITRAQKRMLLEVYNNPHFALYGAPAYECARNLMNHRLVRLVGHEVILTTTGKHMAEDFELLEGK